MSGLTPGQGRDFSQRGQRMMRRVEKMPKPVIAMVNGFALGGGLELAMCCHLRIAADTAKVGQPEINLGLVPGFGGTQRLLRLAGRAAVLELCLTGAPIDATRAQQLGIVNRVVPAAELEAETMKLAAQLAAAAPLALRGILDCVNVGADCALDETMEYEAEQFGLVFSTDDIREDTRALPQRPKPEFSRRRPAPATPPTIPHGVNVGADCALDEAMEYEAAQFGLVFSTDDMREGTRAFLERRKPEFSGR